MKPSDDFRCIVWRDCLPLAIHFPFWCLMADDGPNIWFSLVGGRTVGLYPMPSHGHRWWRETTDHVILNSPWLKRETGHAFRFLWALMHLLWWYFHYSKPLGMADGFVEYAGPLLVHVGASQLMAKIGSNNQNFSEMAHGISWICRGKATEFLSLEISHPPILSFSIFR